MKAIFFGLGSIGFRHARLLKEMGGYEVYAFRSGQNGKGNSLGIAEVTDWQEIDALKPGIAFITNPTHLHIETALACAERDMTLFLEKPIGSSLKGLEGLLNLVDSKKIPTYVAYVLRFHPAVKLLKEKVIGQRIRRARFICRSYFPDWRPGQNHLESYSARRETGGGALLELSHEFDLASYLLGPIKGVSGHLKKRGDVTRDAEDFVEATVRTEACEAKILVDIASQTTERKVTVETKTGTLTTDLMQTADRDEPYREQLHYFMAHQKNPRMMNNIFEATPLFEEMIRFREREYEKYL